MIPEYTSEFTIPLSKTSAPERRILQNRYRTLVARGECVDCGIKLQPAAKAKRCADCLKKRRDQSHLSRWEKSPLGQFAQKHPITFCDLCFCNLGHRSACALGNSPENFQGWVCRSCKDALTLMKFSKRTLARAARKLATWGLAETTREPSGRKTWIATATYLAAYYKQAAETAAAMEAAAETGEDDDYN